MLEVERIRVSYGAAPAIVDVSLAIGARELVCVVGPNGAGKSTLINAIAGLHRIDSGALRFEGDELARLPAHRYCDRGIAIVPEGTTDEWARRADIRRAYLGLTEET